MQQTDLVPHFGRKARSAYAESFDKPQITIPKLSKWQQLHREEPLVAAPAPSNGPLTDLLRVFGLFCTHQPGRLHNIFLLSMTKQQPNLLQQNKEEPSFSTSKKTSDSLPQELHAMLQALQTDSLILFIPMTAESQPGNF